MKTALNIAIAEATSTTGRAIAKKLAAGHYRLLLLGEPVEKAEALQQELTAAGARAEILSISCARDACWEADVVVITLDPSHFSEVAARIEAVVTGKTVLCVSCGEEQILKLQGLLPHAHVMALQPKPGRQQNCGAGRSENDKTALAEVMELCSSIGL